MMSENKKPLIKLSGVTMGYRKKVILESVDFELFPGDYLGIIGPNGAGKTTLLKTVLGLSRPLKGKVETADGISFGYVKQRQFLDDIFPFTVREVVMMGRYGRIGPIKRPSQEDNAMVEESLGEVGAFDLANQEYRNLSGGQKQRVLIARALAGQPSVLVLDEPTNDMDVKAEEQIMHLIGAIREHRNVAIMLVSHLLNVVLNHVESIAFLREGKLELFRNKDRLDGDYLSRLFGVQVNLERIDGKSFVIPTEQTAV